MLVTRWPAASRLRGRRRAAAYTPPPSRRGPETIPAWRDAAVMDFPTARAATGLYAFGESGRGAARKNERCAAADRSRSAPTSCRNSSSSPTTCSARATALGRARHHCGHQHQPGSTFTDRAADRIEGGVAAGDRWWASRKNLYARPRSRPPLIDHPSTRRTPCWPIGTASTARALRVRGGERANRRGQERRNRRVDEAKACGYRHAARSARDKRPTFTRVCRRLPMITPYGHVRTDNPQLVATIGRKHRPDCSRRKRPRAKVERILKARA